jgi:beta-phosphoglucomutase
MKSDIYFRELLKQLTSDDILPGVESILGELKKRSIKIAIGSSSKNSPSILERIGLGTCFDTTSDGNDIENSKPDPEVFLIAAKRLSLLPEECLVVEDAGAGVEAAIAGGMSVLAVGSAKDDNRAHISATDMDSITVNEMLDV